MSIKLSPAMIKAMNELRDTGEFKTASKRTIDALKARNAFELIDSVAVVSYEGAKAMAEVDPTWVANSREVLAAVAATPDQTQDEWDAQVTPIPAHPVDVWRVVPNRAERRKSARQQRINAKRDSR